MTLSGVCQSFSRRRAADFSTFDAWAFSVWD